MAWARRFIGHTWTNKAFYIFILIFTFTCDNRDFVIASILYPITIWGKLYFQFVLFLLVWYWWVSLNSSSLPCSHFVRFLLLVLFIVSQHIYVYINTTHTSKVRQWCCCFFFLFFFFFVLMSFAAPFQLNQYVFLFILSHLNGLKFSF